MKFCFGLVFNIFVELSLEFTFELVLCCNAIIALLYFCMPLAPPNHSGIVKVKCSVVNLIGVLLNTDSAKELLHAPWEIIDLLSVFGPFVYL